MEFQLSSSSFPVMWRDKYVRSQILVYRFDVELLAGELHLFMVHIFFFTYRKHGKFFSVFFPAMINDNLFPSK